MESERLEYIGCDEAMNAFAEREVIIGLALLSALLFGRGRRWETVLTRVVLALVYVYILCGFAGESARFLMRWSLILMLVVENIFNLYVELKHGQ